MVFVFYFRFLKMTLFIHGWNHCTVYSIVPGSIVSIDHLSFFIKGKQIVNRNVSRLAAMAYRVRCCYSRCCSFFSLIKVPFPAHEQLHLHRTIQYNPFFTNDGSCRLFRLYSLLQLLFRAGVKALLLDWSMLTAREDISPYNDELCSSSQRLENLSPLHASRAMSYCVSFCQTNLRQCP